MQVNDIITLANDKIYLILDEVKVEDNEYILVAGLEDDKKTLNADYQILQKKYVDNKWKVNSLPDNQFKADLLNLFAINTTLDIDA